MTSWKNKFTLLSAKKSPKFLHHFKRMYLGHLFNYTENIPQVFPTIQSSSGLSISSIDHPVAWFYLWQLFVLYFKFLSAVPIIPVSFASCPKPQHHSTQFPEPLLGNIPLPTWISPW